MLELLCQCDDGVNATVDVWILELGKGVEMVLEMGVHPEAKEVTLRIWVGGGAGGDDLAEDLYDHLEPTDNVFLLVHSEDVNCCREEVTIALEILVACGFLEDFEHEQRTESERLEVVVSMLSECEIRSIAFSSDKLFNCFRMVGVASNVCEKEGAGCRSQAATIVIYDIIYLIKV